MFSVMHKTNKLSATESLGILGDALFTIVAFSVTLMIADLPSSLPQSLPSFLPSFYSLSHPVSSSFLLLLYL